MQNLQMSTAALNILIPWDGAIPIDPVLAFAQAVGGPHARLMLLPFGSGCAGEWSRIETEPGSPRALLEVLDPAESSEPAMEIPAIAAMRNADLILLATTCDPGGEIDARCHSARLALDSPIPVMLVRVDANDQALLCQPITRLLVPLDGSLRAAQALPLAANLARNLNLGVHLVMVIDPRRVLPPAYAYDPEASAEMVARLRNEAHGALTLAEGQLALQGVEVTSTLLYGPVISCLEAAVQPGDVIVMTTHGVGGALHDQFGSVAARLVVDIAGPLVIMRGSLPESMVVKSRTSTGAFISSR